MNMLRCCTERLQTTPIIKIFRRPYIKVSNKMEILLKQADQVPRNFELIYRYPTFRMAGFMFHTVNWMAITTIGIVSYAWYFDKSFSIDEKKPRFVTSAMEGAITAGFGAIIVLITWTMRSRTPMRVYYHPDSRAYRAIFIGKIPYSTEYHEFQKGEMSYVSQGSILPWRTALFQANGRKMLLYDDYFRTQADLVDMFKEEKK